MKTYNQSPVASSGRSLLLVVGLASALATVLAGAAPALAQPCASGWTRLLEAPGVPARSTAAVAAEGSGQTVVLFGGSSGGTTYGDTWVRTITNWQKREVVGPSIRTGHVMAYDAARGRTVLFGGNGGSLTDTWEWNGTAWAQLQPGENPGARNGATLVYGGAGRVLLLGGSNDQGAAQRDVWSWDGANWTNLGDLGLPARLNAGAAFDASRQVVVVYGGLNPVSFDQLADTWEFDGTSWAPVGFGEPGAREDASLAYDAARGLVVLYGGTQADTRTFELSGGSWLERSAAGPKPELPLAFHGGIGRVIQLEPEPSRTWAWDGAAWTVNGVTLIPATNAAAGAWDPTSSRFAVFGGSTFLGRQLSTLWTLGHSGWELAAEGGPAARDRAGLVADTSRSRLVLFGGTDADANPLGDTWTWNGTAWTELPAAGLPARTAMATAYDPVRDRVVVFGGRDADFNFLAETWTFNSAAWSQVTTASAPTARDRAAMTFDASRGKVVLFGGRDENFSMLDDLWEFDGATWTQIVTPVSPQARSSATLNFDPVRNTLVLTGGLDNNFATLDGTWVYSAAAGWQNISLPTLGARSDHASAFDPARGTVMVFGGFTGSDTVGDTWAFTGGLDLAIDTHPQGATVCPGGSTSLSITASGAGQLSYQWRQDGSPIDATTNPSAATPTLLLSNIQPFASGSYDCVITVACGSSTSLAAQVSVVSCSCSLADIAGTGDDGRLADGIVDGSDFVAFINSFGTGDPFVDSLADVAGGGDDGLLPDGVIDGNDFVAFINAFAAGC